MNHRELVAVGFGYVGSPVALAPHLPAHMVHQEEARRALSR